MADSTTKKKNYAKGSAKQVKFANGSEIINLDFKIEGKIIGNTGDILPNEKGYVKIVLSKLKETDAYGNDYGIYENDFKPDPKMSGKPRPMANIPAGNSDEDLPF